MKGRRDFLKDILGSSAALSLTQLQKAVPESTVTHGVPVIIPPNAIVATPVEGNEVYNGFIVLPEDGSVPLHMNAGGHSISSVTRRSFSGNTCATNNPVNTGYWIYRFDNSLSGPCPT